MRFSLLASGSQGNCCVIQHKDTSIVIDCGTTKKYLLGAFEQIAYDYQSSDAILITHTHSDHIAQMKMFEQIPTYATSTIPTSYLHTIAPFEEFNIKDIHITVLPMSHDCEGTVGFLLKGDDEKLVYITDTGYVKEEVRQRIQNADYYILESNHDIEMLMQTNRPIYLKQRIIGDSGHLCNEDCAGLVGDAMGEKTKEIVLAHISREGNTREKALETLTEHLRKRKLLHEQLRLFPAGQFEIYQGGKKDL